MLTVLLASVLQLNLLTSFNNCNEVQAILSENVESGYISKREADKILRNCRKYQKRSAG
jgi:hypothetical protein